MLGKLAPGADMLEKRPPAERVRLADKEQAGDAPALAFLACCREKGPKDALAANMRVNHAGHFLHVAVIAVQEQTAEQGIVPIEEKEVVGRQSGQVQHVIVEPHAQVFVRITECGQLLKLGHLLGSYEMFREKSLASGCGHTCPSFSITSAGVPESILQYPGRSVCGRPPVQYRGHSWGRSSRFYPDCPGTHRACVRPRAQPIYPAQPG